MITVFLDMDKVLSDFPASPMLRNSNFKATPGAKTSPSEMYEEFFFETLPPVEGALWAVRELLKMDHVDLHVLTQPVKETHYSYSEKAAWVAKWFPELLGKLTLTQNKEFLSGKNRVLVDDNESKWRHRWEDHGGIFIHFKYHTANHKSHWRYIIHQISQLKNHIKIETHTPPEQLPGEVQ